MAGDPPAPDAPAPVVTTTLPPSSVPDRGDPRAVLAIASDGRIRSVGGAVGVLLGHEADALVGRSITELVDGAERDAVLAAMSRVLVDGGAESLTTTVRDAMGLARDVELSLGLLGEAPDGVLVASLSAATSVPSARDLVLGHDPSVTLIVLTDGDGAITHVSSGAEALLGWTPEQLAELGQAGIVHPMDLTRFRAVGSSLRAERGGVRAAVVRMSRADGDHLWVRAVGVNLLGDPTVRGVVTAITDATDEVRRDMARTVARLQERGVVPAGHDLVLIGDDTGAITVAGGGMARLFGIEPEGLLGMPTMEGLGDDSRRALRHAYRSVLTEPRVIRTARFQVWRANGDPRWITVEMTNRSDDPDVRGVLMVFTDVTERMEADEAVRASERRFRKLVQHSSDILAVVALDWRVSWVSPAVERTLGYRTEAVVGLPIDSVVHPRDETAALTLARTVLSGGTPAAPAVVRVRHADGSWRHLSLWASDLTADHDVGGLLFNATDVTHQVEVEAAQRRMSLVLEASTDLTLMATRGESEIRCNPAGAELLGLEAGATIDLDGLADRVPTWVRRRFLTEVVPSVEDTGLWEGELAVLDPEGDTIPLSVVAVGLLDADGRVDTVAVVCRDISERKAFEDQLEHQATHDPLTGLPNRTLMLDRLGVALGRATRHVTRLAVLFLDLDNFKVINDSLGHAAGDELLVVLASRLGAAVRPGDTVARFGGDEFAVLCEDLDSDEHALTVAARIEEALAQPVEVGGTELSVTVSIGVAVSDGAHDADAIVRDADAAMYQAKARGRSRTEVFDAAMHIQAVDRLALETALRHAVERDELRTVFQPQIALGTGQIIGAETLVRWERPGHGLLLPGAFLPLAEETGLIVPIGNWVLASACRALAELRARVPEAADFVMSVNLSARQLASPQLIDDVAAIVAAAGVPPHALMLEVTETDLMDVGASGEALTRLHQLGVGISVDDFGTGWSSLRYLRHFPVDVLKVDRSFVSGLGRDPEDEAIVAAVIDLAHALGLAAVAEGVEHDVQHRRLVEMSCDAAQGWLISHPVSADALVDLVGTGRLAIQGGGAGGGTPGPQSTAE